MRVHWSLNMHKQINVRATDAYAELKTNKLNIADLDSVNLFVKKFKNI